MLKILVSGVPALALAWLGFAPAAGLQAQGLPDPSEFDRVLAQVVEQPLVDYAELTRLGDRLEAYITTLGRTDPGTLASSSREERLAFWINAYNACMLKVVADHYPLGPGDAGIFGSVRNFFAGYPSNSVWQIRDVFGREHCSVAGQERSQDEIEHEIIRPTFDEPRIHFAVNCAARSCPVLWPEAYRAENLEAQLDRAVQHFIASEEHFQIERGPPPVLRLNQVMDWYRDDFGGVEGLKAFFAGYLTGERRELLLRPETEVVFFDYDWTLNDTAQ